jgi:hypothetical protein
MTRRRSVAARERNRMNQNRSATSCVTGCVHQGKIIMTRPCQTLAVLSFLTLPLWITQAIASQGPGVMPGSAGATTQLAMAIIVYGGSALLVVFGLIGAARQRRARR